MPAAVNLHVVGLITRLVVLLLQSVFSMADACDVASNSFLTHDHEVDRQGSPQVGVAIPSEYEKAPSGAKLLSQCTCGVLSSVLPAYPT